MSGINRDDWLSAYKAAMDAPLPPSDALTVKEFGALIGFNHSHAHKRLKLMVETGIAELTKKQVRRDDGGIISVPAYRLKKPFPTKAKKR